MIEPASGSGAKVQSRDMPSATFDTGYDALVQFGAVHGDSAVTHGSFALSVTLGDKRPRPNQPLENDLVFSCTTWTDVMEARSAILLLLENSLNDDNKLTITMVGESRNRLGATVHRGFDLTAMSGYSVGFHCALGHWSGDIPRWYPLRGAASDVETPYDRLPSEVPAFVNAVIELCHLSQWSRILSAHQVVVTPGIPLAPPVQLFDYSLHCGPYVTFVTGYRTFINNRARLYVPPQPPPPPDLPLIPAQMAQLLPEDLSSSSSTSSSSDYEDD